MRQRLSVNFTEKAVCPSCHNLRDNIHYMLCDKCREKQRERNKIRYREKRDLRLAKGLCPSCGVRPAINGGRCAACRVKAAQSRGEFVKKAKAQGLCIWCGKEVLGKGNLCEKCREKRNSYARLYDFRRYRQRIAQGLCPRCGGPRDFEGRVCCSGCIKKEVERRRANAAGES